MISFSCGEIQFGSSNKFWAGDALSEKRAKTSSKKQREIRGNNRSSILEKLNA